MKKRRAERKSWLHFFAIWLFIAGSGAVSIAQEAPPVTSPSKSWERIEDILASEIQEIHSMQYCSRIKDPKEEAKRERAITWGIDFARWLFQHQKTFRSMPWGEFQTSIEQLIKLRDSLAQKPSYGNYVLAGYIDMVVQEWLLQRLILTNTSLDDLKKLTQISNKPFYTSKSLGQMLEQEYGKQVIDYEEMETRTSAEQFIRLWAVPQELGEVEDPAIFGIVDLLRKRSASEAMLQIVGPSTSQAIVNGLIVFKEKNGAFPSTQKEFEASLQKAIPEILEATPNSGQKNYPSTFWSIYQEVKNRRGETANLEVEPASNVDD